MCAFHGWQLRQLPLQAQVKVLADANRDLAAALQESTHEFSAERPGLAESERQERGQEVEFSNSGGAGSQTRKSEGEGSEGLREEKGGDSERRSQRQREYLRRRQSETTKVSCPLQERQVK